MADRQTAQSGGFKALLEEALPSAATARAIFANAPDETRLILLTIRTAPLTMRFDGNVPTAGANGHDYWPSQGASPYELTLNPEQARNVRAIQSGGTATGWITYLGIA